MSKNSTDANSCPLCGAQTAPNEGGSHRAIWYRCKQCGDFTISYFDREWLDNPSERSKCHPERISSMLRERRLGFAVDGREVIYALRFTRGQSYGEIPGTVGIWIDELLTDYPQPSERVERCFCAFVKSLGEEAGFGKWISIETTNYSEHVLFAHTWEEACYLVQALNKYGWLEVRQTQGVFKVQVGPKGWEHYDWLTRTRGYIHNHVFVAMWFGKSKPNRTTEMQELFDNTIKPVCQSLGWRVKRADTDEHNEPIMDRVIADILAAPFVIAELTENNQGVYYEAGFARGLGKEVIYCCPEGQRVHFDVTGVNQVRWKDAKDLKKRLGNRILATKGRGPHKFEG